MVPHPVALVGRGDVRGFAEDLVINALNGGWRR